MSTQDPEDSTTGQIVTFYIVAFTFFLGVSYGVASFLKWSIDANFSMFFLGFFLWLISGAPLFAWGQKKIKRNYKYHLAFFYVTATVGVAMFLSALHWAFPDKVAVFVVFMLIESYKAKKFVSNLSGK